MIPYNIIQIKFANINEQRETEARIQEQMPDGHRLICIETGDSMFPVAHVLHGETYSIYQLIGDEPKSWQLGICESSRACTKL